MNIIELISLIKDIALILGASSVIYALLNYRSSMINNRTQLFLMLRKYYLDIHYKLHSEIPLLEDDDHSREPLTSTQKAAVQAYWINSFNEWYTTTQLYKGDTTGLWKDYYRRAIGSGLIITILRNGLQQMFERDYCFGQCEREFKKEMESISDDILSENMGLIISNVQRSGIHNFRNKLKART